MSFSRIKFSSRYYNPLMILVSKVSSDKVFKLHYNEDKETFSFPYLYKDYKSDILPILKANQIMSSVKSYLEENLYNIEEKKLLITELFPYIENFGNKTIVFLTSQTEKINIEDEEHFNYIKECKKTITSLNQIREILKNESILYYTNLTEPIHNNNPLITSNSLLQNKKLPGADFPDEVYKNVLKTLLNYGKDLEMKPRVYSNQSEEGLRDHFLTNLTGRYERTTATGETFNSKGKTDILLKDDLGNNIFIAECKWWNGSLGFNLAINQLFDNYISWRDTKVALIFFVENKGFTTVIEQIENITKKHPYFVKFVGKSDKSSFSFIFRQKLDEKNEVKLEILLFHFPKV